MTKTPWFDTELLRERLEQALVYAKQQGATAAELELNASTGFAVSVRLGEVETVEHQRDQNAVVTVYLGQHTGSASCTDFSESSLRMTVEKACSIARFTEEDDCAGLANAELMTMDYPQVDLYHPWDLTPDQGITLALQCEQLAREQDKRITNSEGATLTTQQANFIYGNTHGFYGSYPSSQHSLSCSLIASQQDEMQREYDYTVARAAANLDSVATLAKRVAQNTVQRLGARKLATRRCPVIFSAEMARSLFGHFLSAISGTSLYRRTSFLLDKLHQPVFSRILSIDERPHLPKGLGSAPFDNEGVATRAKDLVRDGVLQSYLLDSYAARKLGMQTTGNAGGAHNVMITASNNDLAGLLRVMDKGLLVTELIGQGVNLLTGDYSRGAFGFWVEHGQIQYPVHEITIAGNLADMFLQIATVANDIDRRGNVQTGSVLIENMTVAGQ